MAECPPGAYVSTAQRAGRPPPTGRDPLGYPEPV